MKIRVEIKQTTLYLFEVDAKDGMQAVDLAMDIFTSDEFDPEYDCVNFVNLEEPEWNVFPGGE